MAAKHISQRDARNLRKRVATLEAEREAQRRAWSTEWPGGTHITSVAAPAAEASAIRTARRLRHAVVATVRDNGEVLFYALPVSK